MGEIGPNKHLYWLGQTKQVSDIPIIASLNAVHEETWLEYVKLIELTGVDAIELNLYSSPEFQLESSDIIEQKQIQLVKKIRDSVNLPICVKLSPFYTNTVRFIDRLDRIGINGFVLFNRFFQSNIDIDGEEITFPFTFTHKEDNRLSMRYAGLLYGNIKAEVCCSRGITDAADAVKMLLAGAGAVQVVSALYKNGVAYLSEIIRGIAQWMDQKKYAKITDFRGKMSRQNLEKKDAWAYKRTQYVKMLMQAGSTLMEQIQ
jgi:dihydroorotate dehydrogenase (fumarate)